MECPASGNLGHEIILDIDATLVSAHSDKEGAAPTYKYGYGHHPILCCLGGEALAGILRPGNAGANTAADHIAVLADGLDQLPEGVHDNPLVPILVRADSAGCTHNFLQAVVDMKLGFSVSMQTSDRLQQAILNVPEDGWTRATGQDMSERDGAWVTELHGYDLTGMA